MSKVHDVAIKEIMSELVGDAGNRNPFTEMLVNSYTKDLLAEAELLIKSGGKYGNLPEDYLQKFKNIINQGVIEAIKRSSYFKDGLYKKSYEKLKALSNEGKDYGDLFTEIYQDETYLNEIFIRLVEEREGVAITSEKQLQELTGITEIYGRWEEEGNKKPTKKEAQEIAFKQIEETFTSAMSYRYSKALEDILETGGKYGDLLKLKPSYFNLPETWSGGLGSDQYSSILWVIVGVFDLNIYIDIHDIDKIDLKTIAQEIEAPYSVLMDANRLLY